MDRINAKIGRSRPGADIRYPIPDTRYPIPDIRRSSSDSFFEKPDNLTPGRVPLETRLFEDRHAIMQDLETAAARGDQIDLEIRKPLLQLSRQTGGSGLVVSNRAILYRDPHRRAS